MKRLTGLILLLLASTASAQVVSVKAPTPGTVTDMGCDQIGLEQLSGFYPMEEGSGTVLLDTSTGTHHGTLVNTPTWVRGKCGWGLNFAPGSSEYVNLGSPIIGDANVFTMLFWVQTVNAADYIIVYAEAHATLDNTNIVLGLDDGTPGALFFQYRDDATTDCSFGSANLGVRDGRRHQIGVVQRSRSDRQFIFDGALQDSSASNCAGTFLTMDNTTLGAQNRGGLGQYFDGMIDGARIYVGRALSAQAIKAIYDAGK